jgi:hypothetical protein
MSLLKKNTREGEKEREKGVSSNPTKKEHKSSQRLIGHFQKMCQEIKQARSEKRVPITSFKKQKNDTFSNIKLTCPILKLTS